MTKKLTSNANATVLIGELPLFLREKMAEFIERNKIISKKTGSHCCTWCLKAHLLEKAREKGMDSWAIELIEQIFPGNAGHNGYYMDSEEVKKIILD
ncbi:MAG: hypothetical protein MUF61_00525 [archaeon]|jgi:hypothetical protein|nr:hypothetical protein [archaeon]